MGQKIITLSGAATDVLYALFLRGALQSGDLPSKSGAAELRELGFVETRHAATEYQKENYYTFLTAEGQAFAVKHMADTRKALDELDDKIRNSDAPQELNDIYQFPRMKISSDQQVMKTIADALDEVCRRYFEVFGHPESGKTNAVSLEGRWVAVEGSFTHEEVRDAVEYIKRLRKRKADEKAMAKLSPFAMKDGLSPEMEKAISDVVSAELKKNLQLGGSIRISLERGF